MTVAVNSSRYANWKAPSADGQLLIWPQASSILQQAVENGRLLNDADAVRVQNSPLPELRRAQRNWLGHYENERPLLATGHQAELYHPGVWVKDALMHAAAAKLGGQAYHFAVDTDHPKHLHIRWPGASQPITDDPAIAGAAWCGLLAAPTPAHLEMLEQQCGAAQSQRTFHTMLGDVLASMRRFVLDWPGLATALTNAQHALDWELGLRHHAMMLSPMLASEPYLTFVYHVLANAPRFAGDYNAALGEYRAEAGIKSSTRPMPDLQVTADAIEVPFWLDDVASGTRRRAEVKQVAGDRWALEDFAFDPALDGETAARQLASWLRQHQLSLSPRALTLTLFLRLFVTDLFVHGIGGGRYDQVTDRLIARHFKLAPPVFAVTTATLYFPGAVGRSRVCVSCLAQEGHRLRHELLGEKKRGILSQIEAMPRRSMQRLLAFQNMHAALTAAAVENPKLIDWERRSHEAEERDREDEVIFDRELFYAMQTRERLVDMIERCVVALS
jgi:hypothetical protein